MWVIMWLIINGRIYVNLSIEVWSTVLLGMNIKILDGTDLTYKYHIPNSFCTVIMFYYASWYKEILGDMIFWKYSASDSNALHLVVFIFYNIKIYMNLAKKCWNFLTQMLFNFTNNALIINMQVKETGECIIFFITAKY